MTNSPENLNTRSNFEERTVRAASFAGAVLLSPIFWTGELILKGIGNLKGTKSEEHSYDEPWQGQQ